MEKKLLITNSNRDGAKLWFEQINESNEYKICTDKDFVLQYSRILFDELPKSSEDYDFNWNGRKAKCTAFDPSGGPFISVGAQLDKNHRIDRIYRDYNIDDKSIRFVISIVK